jgi:hypothetical protein
MGMKRSTATSLEPMKTFVFRAEHIIDAETEAEAREKFADNSWDFAASAECEEITTSSPSEPSASETLPEEQGCSATLKRTR